MTDLQAILETIAAGAAPAHSPAYRQRVRATGVFVALTSLASEARHGDAIIRTLTDAARALPGDWAGYPLLHGMEAAGLVTSATQGRSPRRLYAITAAGRTAAASLRACLLAGGDGDCAPALAA